MNSNASDEKPRIKDEISGPKGCGFTSGPDYGDGCYNIKGNVDLRALSDVIVKFMREWDRLHNVRSLV